jgi:hypothetical protein
MPPQECPRNENAIDCDTRSAVGAAAALAVAGSRQRSDTTSANPVRRGMSGCFGPLLTQTDSVPACRELAGVGLRLVEAGRDKHGGALVCRVCRA